MYKGDADTMINVNDLAIHSIVKHVSLNFFGNIIFLPLQIKYYGVFGQYWINNTQRPFRFVGDMSKGVSLFLFRQAVRDYFQEMKENDHKKNINNPVNNAAGWKV